MKAVQRMSNAWRRFFFCGKSVIYHPADSVRCVPRRDHAAAGRPWARGSFRQM